MDSLADWLRSQGLERLEPRFAEHGIDLDILADLTADDLAEMGIPLGDRKRVLRAVADWAETGASPGTGLADAARSVSPGPVGAERRQLTIVFCDLVGSTELASRLDPEELGSLIKAYQQCCMDVVRRWGGHLAEFLGDGAVVYFGWPRAHENDAERAVHAALDLARDVAALPTGLDEPLSVRSGIATGLVMVGEIMSEGVTQRDGVVGATPNLAARIQSLAPPGLVAISAQTRKLVGDRFEMESQGAQQLKGIPEPVEVWIAKGVKAHRSRFEARSGGRVAPLVGRRREMALLLDAWKESSATQGRTVLLTGEPGIGKSRMLKALLDHPLCVASPQLRLQCSPYHEATPLMPFVDWLNQAAGISLATEPSERSRRVESYADGLGLPLAETMPLLASLLTVPLDPRYPPLALSPQVQRERTIDLLTGIVRSMMEADPGLMVVEDLHWVDPTTRELLRRLTSTHAVPGLLVMTARPTFADDFASDRITRIDLERLDAESVEDLVVRLSGMTSLPRDVLESIRSASDGVPLFVEELTRALVDSGRLADPEGQGMESGDRAATLVPSTLHDLLVARLDGLDEGRTVAQVASALGRSFSSDLLCAVMRSLGQGLNGQLDRLCDAGILDVEASQGRETTYAFRHAMVREAAYHSQLKARRREVHRIVADVLHAGYPAVVEGQPEVLAYHFGQGGRPEKAADYMLTAGQKALHVAATHEAISHLSGGLKQLEDLPPSEARDRSRMRLHASLGTSYMLARGWAAEEVAAEYESAAELSRAAESTEEAIWILWGIWVVYNVRGWIDDATEASGRIQALADADGGVDAALLADMMALQVHLYGGRFGESAARSESFLRRFDPDRHRAFTDLYSTDLELVCLVHRAINAFILGDSEVAAAYARQAEEVAAGLDHPYSYAWCHTWGTLVDLWLGRADRAAERCRDGMRVAREQEYAYVTALGSMILGWANGELGDFETGARQIEEGLTAFRSTGAEIVVPFFLTLRAELLIRAGYWQRSLPLLEDAAARIRRWGERWQEAEVHRVMGLARCAEAGGSLPPAAEAAFEQAIEVATAAGAAAWRIRACTDFARELARAGRRDRAIDLLGSAVEDRGVGASPDRTRAESLLVEMGA